MKLSMPKMKLGMAGLSGSSTENGKAPPQFIKRVWLTDSGVSLTQPLLTPANAGFAFVYGIGAGGSATAFGASGGGAHYAAAETVLTPGETLDYTVGVGRFTRLRRQGTVVLLAAAGLSSTGQGASPPITSSVGRVVRVGTSGYRDGSTTPVTIVGGSAGNDLADNFSLNLFGTGAIGGAGKVIAPTGFGGGGARGLVSGDVVIPPQGGVLVIEYWTSDPRNIIL